MSELDETGYTPSQEHKFPVFLYEASNGDVTCEVIDMQDLTKEWETWLETLEKEDK